jgi:Flp pilus assembly secretin CpaC
MTRQMRPIVTVMLLALIHPLAAQAPTPAPAAPAPTPQPSAAPAARGLSNALVPVQLQITIVRYQGEKRISSFPYVVSLSGPSSPGGTARLRMNGSIPVSTTMMKQGDDGQASTVNSFNYREIGTNIDVTAVPSIEGRFGFIVTVTDSSVYGEGDVKALTTASGLPMFRSFNASSTVQLRDGETAEFTAAADRLTGEVTKVEVTLTVLK